jgi:chloride channel protein, CIC family
MDGHDLEEVTAPREPPRAGRRVVLVCAVAVLVALGAGLVAQLLTALIGLVTNLAFYGRLSTHFSSPAGNRLGCLVILVPVVGIPGHRRVR